MTQNTFSLNFHALSSVQREQFARKLGFKGTFPTFEDIPFLLDQYENLDNDSIHITAMLPAWFGHESNVFDQSGQLIKSDMCDWMKDYPVYFRLNDQQTGRYMATGYNSTSREQLAKQYREYVSIDDDEEDEAMYASITTDGILDICRSNGFDIEASDVPFEEINDWD